MSRQRHGEMLCQNFRLDEFRVKKQNFFQAGSPGNIPSNDFVDSASLLDFSWQALFSSSRNYAGITR